MSSPSIALIGCGKMGGALLNGMQAANIAQRYLIIDPQTPASNFANSEHLGAPSEALREFDIVILAIKPQVLAQTCADIRPFISPDALVISIAAGQSLNSLATFFHERQAIIRAMPNLPAAILKGASVAIANGYIEKQHTGLAENIFKSVGTFEWIGDEGLMDAVTALSGSGPAYVFHLIEVLSEAGIKAGLSETLSQSLARQTVIGGSAFAEASSTLSASALREAVTSPGGTTEAALKVLMNGEVQELYDQAILAAKKRGEELNG